MRGRRELKPRIVLGYVRCSSDEQALHGVTIEAQRDRVTAFCTATDRALAEIIVDAGQSAKNVDRTGLQAILTAVRAGSVACVVVTKLDRLTRSVADLVALLELFEKHGVALVSVSESLDTSTASGRLMLHILGSVSEWERCAIGERTVAALDHKRRKGEAYGRTPYGFQRDGDRLVPVEHEQSAVALMQAMHVAGSSLREIGRALTEAGYATQNGGPWLASTVRSILRSKATAA